jgi:hypothetical protein
MLKVVTGCAAAVLSVVIAAPAAAQDCAGEVSLICGFVWNDANNNGSQDPGETGIEGVKVTLSDGTDTIDAYTDQSGYYEFDSQQAPPETYTLSIVTSSIGPTAQPSPSTHPDETLDSDGVNDGINSSVQVVVLGSFPKHDLDFGFYTPQSQSGGTGTPGYWKNHPEAWPATVTIGGVAYDRDAAISWLKKVGKDKTTTMFSSLVSAKLNVLIGNDSSCINGTINAADAWIAANGPVGSGVHASSAEWAEGQPLHTELDDYNNGRLCAPHRN